MTPVSKYVKTNAKGAPWWHDLMKKQRAYRMVWLRGGRSRKQERERRWRQMNRSVHRAP